jgi:hypothetical protein
LIAAVHQVYRMLPIEPETFCLFCIPMFARHLFDGDAPQPGVVEYLHVKHPAFAGIVPHDVIHGLGLARSIGDFAHRAKPDEAGVGVAPFAGDFLMRHDLHVLFQLKADLRIRQHVIDLHPLFGGMKIEAVAIIAK